MTLGGKRLRETDKDRYFAKRFFISAQGETGKIGGNETLSIRGNELRINIPRFLKQRLGDKFSIPVPEFSHGENNIRHAIGERTPVSIEIRKTVDGNGFEIFVKVKCAPRKKVQSPKRTLGIDLNYDHLAVAVLDQYGSPVGRGHKVFYNNTGSTTHSLAQIRHAVNALTKLSRSVNARTWVIEDLKGFTGSKSRQDNQKGAWFRRLVSRIPASILFQEFSRTAFNNGVELRSVPAAYTSKLAHYWKRPGSDTHDGAAIVIGRRGMGFTAFRRGSLVDDTQETSTVETNPTLRPVVGEPECPATVAHRAGCVGTHKWLVKQARAVASA